MKITANEARDKVNKRIESINGLIADKQESPEYRPGNEVVYYYMADGMRDILDDLGVLTDEDIVSLGRNIWDAQNLRGKIKLIGQRCEE
jgi:hypothetical protein